MLPSYENKAYEIDNEDKEPIKAKTEEESRESVFREYCKHTSGHGFLKLIESTKIIRYIWIVVLITTSVCLLIHLNLLLARYFLYGLNTAFFLTPNNEAIMPDVTVCPNSKFSFVIPNSYYSFGPDTATVDGNFTFQELFNHYLLLWSTILGNISDTNLARYSIMRTAYNSRVLRSKHDIVMKLNYKMQPIDIATMVESVLYDSLVCITYQAKDRSLNYISGEDDTVLMINTYMVGSDNMYELQTKATKEMDNFRTGAIVYLHAPGTMPNPYTDGQEVYIGVVKLISFAQISIQRCEVSNNCKSNPAKIMVRGFGKGQTKEYEYSSYLCSETTKSFVLFQNCGCRSEQLLTSTSVPDSAPFCHEIPSLLNLKVNGTFIFTNDLSSVTDFRDRIVNMYNCHKKQMAQLMKATLYDSCPPNCVETIYNFDSSTMELFSQSSSFIPIYTTAITEIQPLLTANNINPNITLTLLTFAPNEDLRYRTSFVRITPKTLNVEVAADSLSYPLGNYFSDVGGVFGLYLGFSVISIMEMLELLFQWLIVNRGKCYATKSK